MLAEAPIVDPWPGSVDGTRALVEGFKVLNHPRQVGVGGPADLVPSTSLTSLPTKKTKRISIERIGVTGFLSTRSGNGQQAQETEFSDSAPLYHQAGAAPDQFPTDGLR